MVSSCGNVVFCVTIAADTLCRWLLTDARFFDVFDSRREFRGSSVSGRPGQWPCFLSINGGGSESSKGRPACWRRISSIRDCLTGGNSKHWTFRQCGKFQRGICVVFSLVRLISSAVRISSNSMSNSSALVANEFTVDWALVCRSS